MGVASQIMQHMFRAAEGRLGIDDPVLPIERAQEDGEALLVVKWHALTEEAQLIAGKEAPQSGNELAAEDTTEHLDRHRKLERERSSASGLPRVRRRAPRSGCADVE